MDFLECVAEAASIPEFVENYDRITGNDMMSVVRIGTPIRELIDETTGYRADQITKFAAFVKYSVWDRFDHAASC